MNNETALITGASSGIGLHLAREFAKNGCNLILVAPVQEELQRVSADLSGTHGISVKVIAKDLELDGSPREVFEILQQENADVDILVNNAGHGLLGAFAEMEMEKIESMIRLNVQAPLRLTHLLLPGMISRGSGRILNVASIAGFEPGPKLAVYHATKAFMLSWSEALAVELKDHDIPVTILCPGPTDTDFMIKADMENVAAFQKASVSSPQEVAEAAFKGMMDKDLIVIPGIANKILVQGRRVLTEKAQAKLNKKMYEEVPPEDRKRERGDLEQEAEQSPM
jgi:uncharacterized protein